MLRWRHVATNALATRSGTTATHLLDAKITGKFVTQRNNSKAAFAWANTTFYQGYTKQKDDKVVVVKRGYGARPEGRCFRAVC